MSGYPDSSSSSDSDRELVLFSKENSVFKSSARAMSMSTVLVEKLKKNSEEAECVHVEIKEFFLEWIVEWCEHHKFDEPGASVFLQGGTQWPAWDRLFIDEFAAEHGMKKVYGLYNAAEALGIAGLKEVTAKFFAEHIEKIKECPPTHYFKILVKQSNSEEVLLMTPLALSQSCTLWQSVRRNGLLPDIPNDGQLQIPITEVDPDIMKYVITWCEHHKADYPGERMRFARGKDGTIVWPTWDEEFMEEFIDSYGISQVSILHKAAHFLGVIGLQDVTTRIVADYLSKVIEDKGRIEKILRYPITDELHKILKN